MRLSSTSASHSSSSISSRSSAIPPPALLTSTSTRPAAACHPLDVRRGRDVGLDGASADLGGDLLGALADEVGDDDRAAPSEAKRRRDRSADPRASAGYERRPAVEASSSLERSFLESSHVPALHEDERDRAPGGSRSRTSLPSSATATDRTPRSRRRGRRSAFAFPGRSSACSRAATRPTRR